MLRKLQFFVSKAVLCTLMLLFFGCPAAKPSPDAGAMDQCAAACANLSKLGCSEGDAVCVTVCRQVEHEMATDLKLSCLSAATSKDAARACGTVECR